MARRASLAFHYQDAIEFRANVDRKYNFTKASVEWAGCSEPRRIEYGRRYLAARHASARLPAASISFRKRSRSLSQS
jgi:hypothetical protein